MRLSNPKIWYYAYNEDALKNGSYWREYVGKYIVRYILGDYHGIVQGMPDGLKMFSAKEAKKIIPK